MDSETVGFRETEEERNSRKLEGDKDSNGKESAGEMSWNKRDKKTEFFNQKDKRDREENENTQAYEPDTQESEWERIKVQK